jgi:hypothetical protein
LRGRPLRIVKEFLEKQPGDRKPAEMQKRNC